MAKLHVQLVAKNTEKRTVIIPRRPTNEEMGRKHEYLREDEVDRLLKAARQTNGGIGTGPWPWLPIVTACGSPNW